MNHKIVITGAAGEIGRELSILLSEREHQLHLVDINHRHLASLAKEINATYAVVEGSGLQDAKKVLAAAGAQRLDLVHLAGVVEEDPVLAEDEDVWDRIVDNNLRNAYDYATAMQTYLLEGYSGRLIFTSSLAYRRGGIDMVAYSAAKGGLVGLARALARRFAAKATVNAVAPGIIKTHMNRDLIARRGEALLQEIPLRRFGHPKEVASVIAFLLSEASSYISGQCININGGQWMN